MADFTISSLNSWQWASGSVYYLLGLWCALLVACIAWGAVVRARLQWLGAGRSGRRERLAIALFWHACLPYLRAAHPRTLFLPNNACRSRLVSSMPYLKGDAPSQLDVYVPKITRAYITSRLESGGCHLLRPLTLGLGTMLHSFAVEWCCTVEWPHGLHRPLSGAGRVCFSKQRVEWGWCRMCASFTQTDGSEACLPHVQRPRLLFLALGLLALNAPASPRRCCSASGGAAGSQ